MYLSFYTFTETWIQCDPQTLPMGKFVVQVIKQKKNYEGKTQFHSTSRMKTPHFDPYIR